MRLRVALLASTTLLALAFAGCGDVADPTKERVAALESRLADLDRRLSAVETGLPDTKALRDQLAAVDTRLTGVEGRVTKLQEAPPVAPSAAAGAGAITGAAAARRGQPDVEQRQRAQAMTNLGAEYRRKLAELNAARGDEVDPRERAAQRRELSRWFREQRRALLTGEAPAGGTEE
ncbi:MAG: hypothetical protein KIT14_22195 [bacterium]|nr:hypothetical protein [bacterium]